MIKMGVGLRVATIDLGGWDTHENQGDGSEGYMAVTGRPGAGIASFLHRSERRRGGATTPAADLVTMSEFGRRLRKMPITAPTTVMAA